MRRMLALCASLVFAAAPCLGQDKEEWTADDVVTAESAGSWTISRDGALAAWTKSTVEKIGEQEKRISRLWLTRLATNASIQLTRGDDSARSPRFSPDGTRIAFITARALPASGGEKKGDLAPSQLWVIPVDGGEAWPVTKLGRGIEDYAWADDASFIVLAQETPTLWEQQRKEAKDTTIVVEDAKRQPPARLFRISVEGGELSRITDNDDWIDSLAVSPDGAWAVVLAQQSLSYGYDEKVLPHTRLVDLATGEAARLYEGTRLVPNAVQWRPDSRGFYFINRYSSHPQYASATISELHYHDLARAAQEKVDLAWERGVGFGYAPQNDGVVALLANGATFRPARIAQTAPGWRVDDLVGKHVPHVEGVTMSLDGRTIIYEHSTAATPSQFFAATLDGVALEGERQITDLNKKWQDKPTGRVEVITWAGHGGAEIEGILSYPLDYEAGKRYPLLLNPHGGPAGTSMDTWSQSWAAPRILWRQAGAFVLEPNYHGSAGYGLAFVESIGDGKYYELERIDLNNGVDVLIEQGLVDPEKLGVVGWSNGGILAADLITQSTRWKVASVGAADVEWISDWGNVDFGASFDNYYFGASPLQDPQRYIDKSPFFRLDRVTTPTIVYTGTEDRNVPPSQSWSLFRMLQQLERAPVRLVLFPGEPHGLGTIAHQRRKIDEDLAWFDAHLFKADASENDAVKEGSRLASLLAKQEAATADDQYGVVVNGVLAPEVVERGTLQIGRFEVTRAQFRAFDASFDVPPGTGNLPATGITFERAQAYVTWLAGRTGIDYRLPTAAEAESMAGSGSGSGGGGGNTLEHWVGYAPNPEDAAALEPAIARLGRGALLWEVGTGRGDGTPEVFDLDGNAAEWAVGADGGGVLIGPSADRPGAKHQRTGDAGEAYRGLRVIVGAVQESDAAPDDR